MNIDNKILSGKIINNSISIELKNKIADLRLKYQRAPKLVVVIVGNNQASLTYIKGKKRKCEELEIDFQLIELPETISEELLLLELDKLNKDNTVDGILVQLPLPKHISETKVIEAIDYTKDVDGFHPLNVGKLHSNQPLFVPCTAKGILEMVKTLDYVISGKKVVVVGRSHIVGKPVAELFLQENATVTIAHSKTVALKDVCKQADILIVAVGIAQMIDESYVKPGAVVIDVGINRIDGKLCGDVAFDKVKEIVRYITPVPGGVGPMTIIMLMLNIVESYERRMKDVY